VSAGRRTSAALNMSHDLQPPRRHTAGDIGPSREDV